MFPGATLTPPSSGDSKRVKYLVIIKTEYASIETTHDDKTAAMDHIEKTKKNFKVLSYLMSPVLV